MVLLLERAHPQTHCSHVKWELTNMYDDNMVKIARCDVASSCFM